MNIAPDDRMRTKGNTKGHSLDLLERYTKKTCIFFPCLTKVSVCSPRNQNPPLPEPLDAVEIQGSFHRLYLRISCGDFLCYLNIPERRVGLEPALVYGKGFRDGNGDIVSLERVRERW
jgi:hypothetical protein